MTVKADAVGDPVRRLGFRLAVVLLLPWWAGVLCSGREAGARAPEPSPDSPVRRSRVGQVSVTCPCCGHQFEALVVSRTNTLGGVDRDLFARALGPQPVFYRISTCTKCYYSGYLEDFQEGVQLPPDFVAALTGTGPSLPGEGRDFSEAPDRPGGLSPSVEPAPDSPQWDIPALVRYELAVECYRRLQRSHEASAWLCLRACWVVREENSILPPSERVQRMLEYVRRWLPPDSGQANQADRELVVSTMLAAAIGEGHFNAYQQPYAELVLAWLLRRHGENAPAVRLLNRLLNEQDFPVGLAAAAGRMRDSIEVERRWQHEAARYLHRAWRTGAIARENEPAALYLLGELYRRLGDHSRAVEFFDHALKCGDLPPDLRAWAEEQRTAAQAAR